MSDLQHIYHDDLVEFDDSDDDLQYAIHLSLQDDEDEHEDEDDTTFHGVSRSLIEKATRDPREFNAQDIVHTDIKEDLWQPFEEKPAALGNKFHHTLEDSNSCLASKLNPDEALDSLSSTTEPFQYKPLPHSRCIRLLCLPSERLGISQFSLVTVSLDQCWRTRYTTLSYAWGETFADGSHLSEVLVCDNGIIRVTRSLRLALNRILQIKSTLSGNESTAFIWVDSICINQADSEERGQQVAQMAEIYAKSTSMIIWLGEPSDPLDQWLRTFDHIFPNIRDPDFAWGDANSDRKKVWSLDGKDKRMLLRSINNPPVEAPRDLVIYLKHLLIDRRGDWERLDEHGKTSRSRRAHVELTQRAWFHRKWVIQEMAQTSGKPRFFLIGDQLKDFAEIQDGVANFALDEATALLNAESLRKSLLQNLLLHRNTLCSEPRDHIFALLGLSDDTSWLTIDYTQEVEGLYTAVAEHYILSGEFVTVLALATAQRSLKSLPSWVPDWRVPWQCDRSAMHSDVMITLSYDRRELSRKSGGGLENLLISQLGAQRVLVLKGWLIPNCIASEKHPDDCRKCKLLAACTSLRREGKRPSQGKYRETIESRKASARRKWSGVIQQQFDLAMHPYEVLCLIHECAVGFVLFPIESPDPRGSTTYRLQFCSQVDEEGWLSNWFAAELGEEDQDWIFIV